MRFHRSNLECLIYLLGHILQNYIFLNFFFSHDCTIEEVKSLHTIDLKSMSKEIEIGVPETLLIMSDFLLIGLRDGVLLQIHFNSDKNDEILLGTIFSHKLGIEPLKIAEFERDSCAFILGEKTWIIRSRDPKSSLFVSEVDMAHPVAVCGLHFHSQGNLLFAGILPSGSLKFWNIDFHLAELSSPIAISNTSTSISVKAVIYFIYSFFNCIVQHVTVRLQTVLFKQKTIPRYRCAQCLLTM